MNAPAERTDEKQKLHRSKNEKLTTEQAGELNSHKPAGNSRRLERESSLRIPGHLECVSTLPCEIFLIFLTNNGR